MAKKSTVNPGNLRVFTYVDDDGVIFWSFARLPGRSFKRLRLEGMRGDHYRRFISDVQSLAVQSRILEQDKEEEG